MPNFLFRSLFILVAIMAVSAPMMAADHKTGEEVIAAMRKKYDGKWYKTLTFVQKTVHIKPDGSSETETWYEALTAPGKLRIDIDPVEKGNGMIFAEGKIHSFREGKLLGSRPFVHPLLILGFDVYFQDPQTTAGQLKAMGIDLSVVHQEKWQGQDAYVIGAQKGDLTSPQFWVDKKDLVFVRLFQTAGKDKKSVAETQFNKYYKVKGGGMVSPEVLFFVDGKPTTTEEYSQVKVNVPIHADLYDPAKWMTVDKNYWK